MSSSKGSAGYDRAQRYQAQGLTQMWFGMTALCAVAVVAAAALIGGGATTARSSDGLVSQSAPAVQAIAVAPADMPRVQLETVVIRPSAQQLAEVESTRQARAAGSTASLGAHSAAPRAAVVAGF